MAPISGHEGEASIFVPYSRVEFCGNGIGGGILAMTWSVFSVVLSVIAVRTTGYGLGRGDAMALRLI